MASLAEVIAHATKHHAESNREHTSRDDDGMDYGTPGPTPAASPKRSSRPSSTADGHLSVRKSSILKTNTPIPGTPSARTGPPGSLSFSYVVSSRRQSRFEEPEESVDPTWTPGPRQKRPTLNSVDTQFRSALEYADPEQREHEQEMKEKRERKRANRISGGEDSWNPRKWFNESPREEKQPWDWNKKENHLSPTIPEEVTTPGPSEQRRGTVDDAKTSVAANRMKPQLRSGPSRTPNPPPPPRLSQLQRSSSLPDIQQSPSGQPTASPRPPQTPRWTRLISLLPAIVNQQNRVPGPSVVTPHTVNITDELISGGLSTLMLRMWFERDEKDHRRVPILFHRLRIRISDSLYPLSGHKAVFRIECEYANGAARWVVYRQLRDFISLHTHYTLSNAYNRNQDNLPDFPRTSLPYFKFLNREKDVDVGQSEFARLQREGLENYLLGLIRAVMFHHSANRMAGFLEVSALSISLAQSAGAQYKAGWLRIEVVGSKGGGFGRRSASWKEKRKPKWAAVRESYLVVLEEPGEVVLWDVFLLDSDFKIERPTRYFRQGLNLLHPDAEHVVDDMRDKANAHLGVAGIEQDQQSRRSVVGTIKSSISKVMHPRHRHHRHGRRRSASTATGNGNAGPRRRSSSCESSSSSSSSSSPSSSDDENAEGHRSSQAPMLDPSTNVNPIQDEHRDELEEVIHPDGQNPEKKKKKSKRRTGEVSKHTFYIENSQSRLKLFARNERQMLQWIAAFEKIAATSHYLGGNRFDSFAPIRLNVAAQWLVDGRDYFWNMSRAILLAKETIYIHDWWLSPELQMRRPQKEKYRLDLLLERKAKEGVKIYIILYQEVSSRTTPTDSNYAKQRLMSLHENINVQRSPSHFQTGTFYWAHHEKMCVIDETIAFMGGLDACFGRWDTPQHVLVDDPEEGPEISETIWPGKDYSNPRVGDFHSLNKPFDDMYDRGKVPRMPWHDVSMQIIGQPARDLARHFVQRWNYLLRIKNHSRLMPFLLPPPEFLPGELTKLGLTGTCELQICRSAGPWSMGTPTKIEHSIQNAYLKAIQLSEHFVYIENQFFITSTMVGDVKVENRIGDAIVHRIIRAHREGTPWKCCIMIPLLPGFTFPVDHSDASAIRIIIECQNRTICRGPNSIYGRLRKEGIDPEEYVNVFSLRNWAKLRGDILTTEQVYIHAKVCIVDDRLAIIGSANINERSQRGDRDSELAAIIRDTDLIDGTMAGKPFKVGRFAHTLRIRLMREHLGVDVDAMYEEDLMAAEPAKPVDEQEEWDPENEQERGVEGGITHVGHRERRTAAKAAVTDFTDAAQEATHGAEDVGSKDARMLLHKVGLAGGKMDATAGDKALQDERTTFTKDGKQVPGFTSASVPTLEEKVISQNAAHGTALEEGARNGHLTGEAKTADGQLYGAPADAAADDAKPPAGTGDVTSPDEQAAPAARSILRQHLATKLGHGQWTLPTPKPNVDPHGFNDPIKDSFWKEVWVAAAVHNTEIYRKVFHAIPDDLVTTWKQYREFVAHHERMNKPSKEQATSDPIASVPSETGDALAPGHDTVAETEEPHEDVEKGDRSAVGRDAPKSEPSENPQARRPARGDEPFEKWEREEMEKLLEQLCGHLVLFPTRFLEGEDVANNFLFNADRILPLPIYD